MIGPKEKKERSLGERLYLKAERCNSPKCAVVRKPSRPGVHGKTSRRRAISEFGRQLHEKQKFKVSYGVDERGLRKIFEASEKRSGSTTAGIVELLERRLDNVVFRLGFGGSRSLTRQLIVHGHITVNSRRVRSPGFLVKVGDVIAARSESKTKSAFKELHESLKKYDPPAWLLLDKEKLEGKVLSLPTDSQVPFDANLLVESFSK